MKSLFEKMGGTYTLGADGMYYPDLEFSEEATSLPRQLTLRTFSSLPILT